MKTSLLLITILALATAQQSVRQYVNDNAVLNYALTLENFEAALYASGSAFTDAQYTAAGFAPGTKAAIDYIASIEAGHATLLTNVIRSRGYPAVPACTNYNFNYASGNVTQYVATLAAVEAVGTAAYDGAATALTDKGLLAVAAGIATVEARHTAILNVIINGGFNGSFTPQLNANAQTTALNFTQVLAAVTPFFTAATGGFINCPSNTTNTAYAGSVTVSSTNFSSYAWVTANSLRGQSDSLTGFYNGVNATIAGNDLAIIQYALALENFEAAFYANYSSLYSVSAIQAAAVAAGTTISTFNATLISQNIALIGEHERLHAAYLSSVLGLFNATPGTVCNYTVPLNSSSTFSQFLALAGTIENVGVSAYVGAISYIANSQLSTAAASIATVEGEHAAYINNLLQNTGFTFNPVPQPTTVAGASVDAGVNPNTILNVTVAPFIAQCTPAQLGLPVPIGATGSPYSGTAFLNFFNDQAATFATTPLTSSSTSSTNSGNPATTTTSAGGNNPATTTRPAGSASGLTVCAVVVMAAIFAAL